MKVFGLIGYPLGHSFSKQYFSDKFELLQLADCVFELFPLQKISDFTSLVAGIQNLGGLAVTIPFKEAIIPFLDHLETEAAGIGAVNCIRVSAGTLTGYNTDSTGFERSLVPLLGKNHTNALVLGSGGASRAVQYVLKKLGIRFLVATRRLTGEPGFIRYGSLDSQIMRDHTLIINCTPVGMYPDEQHQPDIPYPFLGRDHLLYDLVYRPAETKFLAEGRKQGAMVKNGYEMLVIQAEENWRIWNE